MGTMCETNHGFKASIEYNKIMISVLRNRGTQSSMPKCAASEGQRSCERVLPLLLYPTATSPFQF